MLSLLVLLSIFNSIIAYEPSCTSCKYFMIRSNINNNNNNKNDLQYGLCKMFKNIFHVDGNKVEMYDFAEHCRKNEHLCGTPGFLYDFNTEFTDFNKRLEDTKELNQLERDFPEIFKKMKKFNKKRIYKKPKHLYQFFQRNNQV